MQEQRKVDPRVIDKDYVVCRYCGKPARKGRPHHCEEMQRKNVESRVAESNDGNFFLSYLIATTTDNWFLGYMVGGNMPGAILGDLMRFTPAHAEPVIIDLGAGQVLTPVEQPASAESVMPPAPDVDQTPGDSKSTY